MLKKIHQNLVEFRSSFDKMSPAELLKAEIELDLLVEAIDEEVFPELFRVSVKGDPEWTQAIVKTDKAKKLAA